MAYINADSNITRQLFHFTSSDRPGQGDTELMQGEDK